MVGLFFFILVGGLLYFAGEIALPVAVPVAAVVGAFIHALPDIWGAIIDGCVGDNDK